MLKIETLYKSATQIYAELYTEGCDIEELAEFSALSASTLFRACEREMSTLSEMEKLSNEL